MFSLDLPSMLFRVAVEPVMPLTLLIGAFLQTLLKALIGWKPVGNSNMAWLV
jgi:hypothetical protein